MLKLEKNLILVTLISFIGTIFFIDGYLLNQLITSQKFIETAPAQISKNLIKEEETNPITLILVGDIMLNRGVEYIIQKEGRPTGPASGYPGYPDFRFPFLKIADDLKGAELLFGNLEGPISDKGNKVGSIYSFRNNPKVIEGLKFAGFNVISLANNHAFDYGREALEDTLLRLKDANIDYIGAGFDESEAYSPILKEIKDTKIAFLAYTNLGPENWKATGNNSGIAWISEDNFEKIREEIKKAKENCDILIISLHAGEEYQTAPTQFQIDFAKMAIDSGADIVIGHHPHVVQSNEVYNGGYIFYSMGNFVFDQDFFEETMKGEIVKVLIENDRIKEVIPKEIKINEFFQPEIK